MDGWKLVDSPLLSSSFYFPFRGKPTRSHGRVILLRGFLSVSRQETNAKFFVIFTSMTAEMMRLDDGRYALCTSTNTISRPCVCVDIYIYKPTDRQRIRKKIEEATWAVVVANLCRQRKKQSRSVSVSLIAG
jgi:hypothetical protein